MWYFVRDGQRQGPVSEEEIQGMVRGGELQPEDLVWTAGMAEWQPASQAGLFGVGAPTMPIKVSAVQPPSASPPPAAGPPAAGPPAAGPPAAGPQTELNPYQQPQAPLGAELPNYLPWAIAVTILCCLLTGIPAIVYANNANKAKAAGDRAAAEQAAGSAKIWIIVSVALGLLLGLVQLILLVASEM